ncbi:MAG TPA: YncE family protein [Candidatus Limnocylindria bacterium]|nr:YncE family protein [Candidatus Limnocylindria bacterium]
MKSSYLRSSITWTLAIAAMASAVHSASGASPVYQLRKSIAVGGDGGWDYLSVDESARRLYVSHGNKLAVVDIENERVIGEITNTPGVHGIAIASNLKRGFTSNGGESKSSMVDLTTLQTLSKIGTGQGPDGMLYEPATHEVYLFNGRGQSATVIDAQSAKVVATIPLGGKPEFATADPGVHRLYNNLEDKNEIAVIDTQSHKVVNHWPIAPAEEPSGMAIDLAHKRLFLGCGGSKTMIMVDSESGKTVASVPIGDGVDANAFDPETQLAFASCGDGTVTIAHEDAPDKLTVVQTLKTERGARTMTLDTKTHRIYLASAEFAPAAPGERRGKMTPDSFKILVYEMAK